MKNKQAICILGGMGPTATSYIYKLLIDLSIKRFGAVDNDDFPEIILHSIPVPDFISNSKDKDIAFEMLKYRVKDLNKLNISCISIACNTAHLLLEDLQKFSKSLFVSMIDEVVKVVDADSLGKVGILGSPMTIKSRLYQSKLEEYKIKVVNPSEMQVGKLGKIIRNVIKGNITNKDAETLTKIANSLVERGAQGVVLGCTELPIIFPLHFKVPVYNSVEILSMALLRRYYESNTINTL